VEEKRRGSLNANRELRITNYKLRITNYGLPITDFRSWILELGFWILDFGFSTRDFRSLASPFIPDAGASADAACGNVRRRAHANREGMMKLKC
jgi:hypothetical protein